MTEGNTLANLPLYCGDCNEVHLLPFGSIERIIYAMQAEYVDLIGGLRTDSRDLPDAVGQDDVPRDCLLNVLGWSHEGEMFKEWTDAMVESRELMQPLDCPNHTDDEGPHHNPLCHYWDSEPVPFAPPGPELAHWIATGEHLYEHVPNVT